MPSSYAPQIPSAHHIHRRLSPRSMRAIFGAAETVGADLPPIHALEPRLRIERFKDGIVAAGLVGGGEGARSFIPWRSVRLGIAAEAGFGEDYGACEFLLDGFYGADEISGRKVIGE